MLNKRTAYTTLNSTLVKKLGRGLTTVAALGTLAIASSASANDGLLVEKVIKVKFNASELATPNGTAKIYAKLKSRAKRACVSDAATLSYTGQTVDQCASELLDQFLISAKNDSLQSFHQRQIA